MNLTTERYIEQQAKLPVTGQHIIGQFDDEKIIVYQAYKTSIAKFATANNHLGGSEYSYTRMTWIKPGFLWMMFRSGWASKENQERILAISLPRVQFETILANAVHTTFRQTIYNSEADWKKAMSQSEIRIQWDPDHHPSGSKLERKAIQLGIKGNMAEKYAKEWILGIEDITDFVIEQKQNWDLSGIRDLTVPKEEIYTVDSMILRQKLSL